MPELADILKVVYNLAELYGGKDALETERKRKLDKRGALEKRLFGRDC